ncbi:MAG: KEOPS complex subunit Cgi121 [Methanolobus sp.]|uniref:KEOPS complex subunit Cgi121 n=1 Tax=Methanolobus sp. TaxID=1874737 RepID=UPI00272F5AFD|nr:KEOPS complex subunit Cgi121 [Methanolobus sp.]MDP2217335.1 KEOPS complex subunit Cgi121 [Methanolobus sp.]
MSFQILGGSTHIRKVPEFLGQISSIASANSTVIQAMDAGKIAGEKHVRFAVRKALRAIEENYNAAKDPGIEIMRYASGKRQIEEAFSMGVHEGDMDLVFVIVGDAGGVNRSMESLRSVISEKDIIGYSSRKRDNIISQFDITEKEIEATGEEMIPDLVIERVALVDVLK